MLALVDDWGDPSPRQAGTKWFGFAALLLLDSQVAEMRLCHREICDRIGRHPDSPLHFRKLVGTSKYHVTRLLAQAKPKVSVIAVRIHAVTSAHLRQRGWAYRFYGKEMVRVATHFAADCGEEAQVLFHRHDYLQGFEVYVLHKLRQNSWYAKKRPSARIAYERLSSLRSVDDDEEPLLGLADGVAHACHTALNPDSRWNDVNPSCLNLLADCVWQGPSYDMNARSFGVILEPGGIPTHLIPGLPDAVRRPWE